MDYSHMRRAPIELREPPRYSSLADLPYATMDMRREIDEYPSALYGNELSIPPGPMTDLEREAGMRELIEMTLRSRNRAPTGSKMRRRER